MASRDRVLSLDGGGIRGLIILEILEAIEKEAGQPIKDMFDWIGGTSTGGIIALGIATGKPISHIKEMYMRLKDQVFSGSRPYDSAPLETFLKQEFGEATVMSDIRYPRVLVTSVEGDHDPWKLHMFRSYMIINEDIEDGCEQIEEPQNHYIWEVARCTSAAPSYFHPYKQFLDGGLMSNNPTLDILTDIHQFIKPLPQMQNAERNDSPLPKMQNAEKNDSPLPQMQNADRNDSPLPKMRNAERNDSPWPKVQNADKNYKPLSKMQNGDKNDPPLPQPLQNADKEDIKVDDADAAKSQMIVEVPVRYLDVVVSVGCGYSNYVKQSTPDPHWPDLSDMIRHPQETYRLLTETKRFFKNLLEQVSISYGQPTHRARAFCKLMNVPFYRFSPLLSENVPLDCVDEERIERMLQDTNSYIEDPKNRQRIKELAARLKRFQ